MSLRRGARFVRAVCADQGQVVSKHRCQHQAMPSDGTKMIDAGWPMEIEFTDKYPGYYLEKLLHGEDWEKDLTASRL